MAPQVKRDGAPHSFRGSTLLADEPAAREQEAHYFATCGPEQCDLEAEAEARIEAALSDSSVDAEFNGNPEGVWELREELRLRREDDELVGRWER